jgi:uncharacterized protein
MKINLDEITEAGFSLDVVEQGSALNDLAGGTLDFSFLTPVKAHLELTRHGKSFFISGEIKASIRMNCGRCAKEFDYPYDAPFSAYYEWPGKGERESELRPADLDVNFLEGSELDTAELLLGQISIELPLQPLCDPECKGLCPKCGADLNLGDCGCLSEGKAASKLAAKLKDLKIK